MPAVVDLEVVEDATTGLLAAATDMSAATRALLAMAQALPASGRVFAAKVVRRALGGVPPAATALDPGRCLEVGTARRVG